MSRYGVIQEWSDGTSSVYYNREGRHLVVQDIPDPNTAKDVISVIEERSTRYFSEPALTYQQYQWELENDEL